MRLHLNKVINNEYINLYSEKYLICFGAAVTSRHITKFKHYDEVCFGYLVKEGSDLRKLFIKLAKLRGVSPCF